MDIIIDIETIGCDLKDLSESQQEFLLRYVEKETESEIREKKQEDVERYLSLYPFTAKIVLIGMLNSETENSLVLYEGNEQWKNLEKNISYKGVSEVEMIQLFWKYIKNVDRVITFNGRHFDLPFLLLRSAKLKVKPSINLIKQRYDKKKHIDLLEMFTFYGLTRKFNLDFYCQSFGIDSPKSHGLTGMDLKNLYRAGRNKEIATYCADDIKSTYQLYKIWKEFLELN